jgi:RNA polymerase primary sigma factor
VPPLRRLRSPALAELVDQLRYAPKGATLRQIERAEALAGEIRPDAAYPEDWIVYRVTGYRPDLDEPRLLVGEALLGDLSTLVERLSEHARLRLGDAPGGLTVEGLALRWRVSRRTIERYRRRGLIARRVRTDAGAVRLAFSSDAVERFERGRLPELQRAGAFTRLSDAERDRAVEAAARELERDAPVSEAAAVERAAAEIGRSAGAVRRAVRAAREEPTHGALSPRERRLVHRAATFGVPTARLAERFGRSRASIRRVALARQAELLRRIELPPAPHAPAAPPDPDHPAIASGLRPEPERDPQRFLDEAIASHPLPAGEERALADAAAFLRVRTSVALEALDPAAPRSAEIDELETALRWWLGIHRKLVHASRGVVARTVLDRLGAPALERGGPRLLAQAHRLGFEAAAGAVARFDPAGGGRVAAPVGLAVDRALAGVRPPGDDTSERARPTAPVPLADWSARWPAWRGVVEAPAWLPSVLPRLGDRDARILVLRFGLDGARPRSLAEVAQEAGTAPATSAAALARARRRWLRDLREGHEGSGPIG